MFGAIFGPVFICLPFIVPNDMPWMNVSAWIIAWLAVCRHNYMLHNHIHIPIAYAPWLNRTINILLGFCSGMPAGNWKIMHVHGHHVEHKVQDLSSRRYLRIFDLHEPSNSNELSGVIFAFRRLIPQAWTPVRLLWAWSNSEWHAKRTWARYYLFDYVVIVSFVAILATISVMDALVLICIIYPTVSFVSIYIDYITHIQSDSVENEGKIRFSNRIASE